MRTTVTKRILAVMLLVLFTLSTGGCLSRHTPKRKLPVFYSDSKIVSVRYFYQNADLDGYRFEELDEDRLDEFVDELNSMELEAGGTLNYYWRGSFGIEMKLEDGTCMIYDGTKAELRKSKLVDSFSNDDAVKGKSDFVYVLNCDFWEVMKEYFSSIEENGDNVYSRSPFHH